ncbi:outer membrane beta-barrel protein [Mucilaginibacter sabulilitoris]|uniref:Outer membrane beta-barrel protein n=1 Tax=Mucilaginibacter sabulilitoris TaxID=1173583 RepID=A0ABZ0TSL9_9SPHI|nr:outer membrane beta-barrel protein [Mucilaginibacter sabulilitoris]WPU95907.1 outer membrane beta-barrel protein [Mucilaginibacter sabulilitoris]
MSLKRYLIIVFILILCSSKLFAQDRVPAWGGGADLQDLSFGFSFAYVSSDFKIVKKPNWRTPFNDPETGNALTTPLNSISSRSLPGFSVGFITRYRLTEHLEARVTPSLVFADRNLTYSYQNSEQYPNVEKQVQTTTVDVPLSLKIKSDRIGDFRAYILGGIKYSHAIGSKKNDINSDLLDKLVKNKTGYGSYEAGLGCDIYFEFFKLSPEIKISNSFGNVLVPENQPFSAPISKLSLHTIMFSLFFE